MLRHVSRATSGTAAIIRSPPCTVPAPPQTQLSTTDTTERESIRRTHDLAALHLHARLEADPIEVDALVPQRVAFLRGTSRQRVGALRL